MTPFMQTLVHYMLTRNLVLVLCFAVLIPVSAGITVRQAFIAGLKWAAAILVGMLTAAAWLSLLPERGAFLFMPGVLLLTLLIVRWLTAWGVCRGDWAGMPRSIAALVPIAGSMLLVQADALAGIDAVAAAVGAATGVYLAIIIVVAWIEQIRIAESPAAFRRIGVLFLAIGILALAMTGFEFF